MSKRWPSSQDCAKVKPTTEDRELCEPFCTRLQDREPHSETVLEVLNRRGTPHAWSVETWQTVSELLDSRCHGLRP
jgi:hypothetical protein